MFLYLVNRRIPVDFRQFLIRHHDLFRNLHHWTVRLLVPRRFRKAVALYKAALREELWTPLNPSVSKSLETYFRERQEQGGHLGDPVRSLHRAGVPKAGHAEDPGPLSGLATIRRQGSLAVVFDVPARRLVHGRSAVEVQLLNRQYLQLTGSMDRDVVGQEGGEAKIASGWPPGFGTLSGRSLTPGGSMTAHSRASACIAAPCRERAIEAALCAAVTAGVGVAVGEPTMA